MARIPTANDLGRVTPRPATGVSAVDISPITRANQQMADSIGRVGVAFAQEAENQDRLAFGKAQSELIKSQLQLQSDFERDNDYGTMQQRYDEKIGQLSGGLSTQISSPRLRAEFDNWATVQNARGQAQIRNMAWNKEKDTNIASLTQTLQDNSNSYMSSNDANEREQIAGATNNLISGAVAKNYINATQGQQLSRNWVVDTAKGSLSLLTPQQRISQLQAGGGLTSFIPPDDRKKILDASAKEEVAGLEGRMMTNLLTPGWSGDANGNIDQNVLHAAMIQQESGGRHFDDKGNLLQSPAGAVGIAQVMRDTASDPGFGVKPLQNDSEEEHLRFSRDYTAAMTKRYGGNPVLILAAYNAGPGVVDDWINGTNKTKKNNGLIHLGDPSKGQISNEAFVNGIPFAETQNYVSSVLANATRAGMVKNVIGSQAFSLLDDSDKATAIGKLYNTIDTATSAQRFNIGQQMKDGIAAVNAGLPVNEPVTVGKFASAMPLNSTPAERAQMWQEFSQYQQTLALQPAFQGIITSPRDVGQSIVNSMTPNANDADFAFKQQKHAAVQQKYNQTLSARESDPAGWMVQNLPSVKDLYSRVQQDPALGPEFVKEVMMQKQRLGIQSKDVLPDAIANTIASQAESGQMKFSDFKSIVNSYGQYSNDVVAQIQKKTKGSVSVAMGVNDPNAADTLFTLRNVKTDELKSNAGEQAKIADTAWNSQMASISPTFGLQRNGGSETLAQITDQGKRLAYFYMASGDDAQSAAKKAYAKIIGDHYVVHDTWRMPNSLGLKEHNVADGLQNFLNGLKVDDVGSVSSFSNPYMDQKQNAANNLAQIQNNGEWVTDENENGVYLTVNGTYIANKNGDYIHVNFSDADKSGIANPRLKGAVKNWLNEKSKVTPPSGFYTPNVNPTMNDAFRVIRGEDVSTPGLPQQQNNPSQTLSDALNRRGGQQ